MGLTHDDMEVKEKRKKVKKHLFRVLKPAIDAYLQHQEPSEELEVETDTLTHGKKAKKHRFQALKPAIDAYLKHQRAEGLTMVGTDAADPESDDSEWREPVELPRMEKKNIVPAPAEDEEPTPPDR